MTDAAPTESTTTGSAGTLRKIKEAEADFDRRLADLKAEGEREIAQKRDAAAAALKAARDSAEKGRELALADAQRQAETEGEHILAAARLEAQGIDRAASGLQAIPNDRLIAAVFGGVAADDDSDR